MQKPMPAHILLLILQKKLMLMNLYQNFHKLIRHLYEKDELSYLDEKDKELQLQELF